MKNKDEIVDDGYTVASMEEVERPNLLQFRSPKRNTQSTTNYTLNQDERKWYILGTLKAALLIGMAYAVGLGAIILLIYVVSLYVS